MFASVMMNLRSMKVTLETQITKVRTMTPITKIETRTKKKDNSSNSSSHSGNGYNKHYNNNGGKSNKTKSNFQDKPTNVQVTLTGPVNRHQLFKIQEVLRHPSQYRDKLPPNEVTSDGLSTLNHLTNSALKRLKSMRQPLMKWSDLAAS